MALPTIVGVGTPAGSVADVTPTKHASTTTDDDCWLVVEANSNQVPLTQTGWTLVDSSSTASLGSTGIALFHQKESGQGNPTVADVGNHLYAVILTTRGGHATTPVDASVDGREETTDTDASIDGLTTTVADCLVVDFIATALDSLTPAWSGWANASLANLVEQFEGGTDAGGGGGIAINTGEKAAAGTVDATTVTTPADHKAYIKLAIAPAAGGTAHLLAGVTNGTSSVTGVASLGAALAGVTSGAAIVAGALTEGFRLVGESAGSSTVTGYMTNEWILSGSIGASSSTSGILLVVEFGASDNSTSANYAPILYFLRKR